MQSGNRGTVPRIDEFRPIVLTVLADGEERHLQAICELAADATGLSREARSETIPSGQRRYVNRINWACSALAQAGLLERPRRGVYRITADGRSVERRRLDSYSENDMLEWPAWREYQKEISDRKSGNRSMSGESPASGSSGTGASGYLEASFESVDPIESAESIVSDYNAEVETKLRRRLQQSSPEFFEKAVIDVLWAMGYGGSHGEKRRVGKAGDGGIDGVIRQDALGLTNVYVQAKRYADDNRVSSPEIRNFIGALDSHGANLGVFITTSRFSDRAKQTAERYRHGRIVLIDGMDLTSLMLTYGVAVQKHREYVLYEVDEDFFDADET